MKKYIWQAGLLVTLLFASMFTSTLRDMPIFKSLVATTGFMTSSVFPDTYTIGVWEWNSPVEFDMSQRESYMDYSSKKGIDIIFLRVDEYIDMYELPQGADRNARITSFENSLASFVSTAHGKGIKVYGVAGHPTWASESHRYITKQLTLFALDYNKRHADTERLSGLQFDIEPYTLNEYNSESASGYITALLKTVAELVAVVERSDQKDNFNIGFAVPYWYDTIGMSGQTLAKSDIRSSLFARIADSLSLLPRTHVAIMAYRNKATGDNGAITLVKNEFEYIAGKGSSTKIFIGQELTNVAPASITFFTSSWRKFTLSLDHIFVAYRDSSIFGGFVINDMEALRTTHP